MRITQRREKEYIRPDPSPLEFYKLFYQQVSATTLNLKAHLKVERQAMIIEKDCLS